MKIVATNVVASQPPERQPTATPTARANFFLDGSPKLVESVRPNINISIVYE